jgi:ketosteroid isomerase-like protein
MLASELVDELHRRQVEMYGGGSTDRVAELLADDVVWHVPGASPIAGDHRGRDGVIAYFETRRRIAANSLRLHPGKMLAEEDCVVQRVDGSAVVDGQPVDWKTVGIYRLEGDRVAEVWLVPLDLEKFDRVWGRRA